MHSFAVTSTLVTTGCASTREGRRLDRRAGQREIAEFLVLERQLGALDLLVRAQARQPLGEMAPVGRGKRTFAVVRAGGRDMGAGRDQLRAQRR